MRPVVIALAAAAAAFETASVTPDAAFASGGVRSADVAVDLTPDLYGTLELHAYKILTSGEITRDTRLVVVDAASGLNLTVTPDHPVYRPGDNAGLDIQVNGQDEIGRAHV